MLSSITPLGERGRGAKWGRTVTAYIIGSTVAGAALGAVLGTLGHLIHAGRASWSLAVACLAGLVLDRKVGRLRLPTIKRQVDDAWLRIYRNWVYGFGFGFQLGLGVGTVVYSSATYILLVAEALSRSPAVGAVLGSVFGLVRSSSILWGASAKDTASLMRLHQAVDRLRPRISAVCHAAQGAAAVAALVTVSR